MGFEEPIRVLVADDHHVVRAGIVHEFLRHEDIDIVGEAQDGQEAVSMIRELEPAVVVLDINMPGMNGLEVMRHLMAEDDGSGETQVLVLSAHADREYVYHTMAAGAKGYLLKDEHPRMIVEGVRRLMRGQPVLSKAIQQIVMMSHRRHPNRLTDRERQVLRLVARGNSDAAIGRKLNITVNTVKNHITGIYGKLPSVRTRAEAVAWAWQNDVVQPSFDDA